MHDGLALHAARSLDQRLAALLPTLRRVARWELGYAHASHADDVVQTALCKALASGAPLPEGDGALRWLRRFVINAARNAARKQRRRLRVVRSEAELPTCDGEVDAGTEPSRALAVTALRDGTLGRALERLDPMEREVFVAVQVDELSEREVSREMGVSQWKVHDRLLSATEKLRRAA